ncbi:MAG: dihydrolipoyl dehydrogenase [bacterium]|nr:dihydrolipoyl dehydrogenase [bacterium]
MNTHRTDILIIGGGPGGYAAAFRASDLGKQITLVEADNRLGGTCLLRGCIPSKALLHAGALIAEAREAKAWGLSFAQPEIDLDKMRDWKNNIVDRLSNGLAGLVRQRKIDHMQGLARFESSTSVAIEGNDTVDRVEFNHAIIATGSRPAILRTFALDSPRIMDSTSALELEEIPKRLLVVGGGIIGLELGLVYAELGSEVTVSELTDGLIPGCDRDLIRPLENRLKRVFKGIHINTRVTHVEAFHDHLEVSLEGDLQTAHQVFDRILISVGRHPNTDHLGLENTAVETDDQGFVQVNAQMRTKDEHILAIGDIVPGPGLAHKASHEGKIAAEVLAGESVAFDAIIPAVVYTDPEIAWCGLTETQARAENIPVEISRFPWAASGRAATLARTEGLTKLVVEPHTHRILGVGIVGPNAGELIAEGVLAVEMAAVAEDLAHSIHPHPSLAESIGIAAEIHLGSATDLYMPKKK